MPKRKRKSRKPTPRPTKPSIPPPTPRSAESPDPEPVHQSELADKGDPTPERHSKRAELLLLIVPAVIVTLGMVVAYVVGPFSLGENIDPEYHYLFNATKLADLKVPHTYQHPGETVLIVAAVVISVVWFFRGFTEGWQPKIESVIAHHNEYLSAIAITLVLMMAVLTFFAARKVYRLTGSMLPAVALQLGVPMCFLTVIHTYQVSPEPMEIIAGLALVLALVPAVLGPNAAQAARNPKLAMAAGCLFACGVASKFNFLSVGMLIFLFDGVKQKLRFLASCLVSLAVLLIPVVLDFSRFEQQLTRRYKATGLGGGAQDSSYLAAYSQDLLRAVFAERTLFLLLSLYVVAALAATFALRHADDESSRIRRALWLGSFAIIAHAAITLTHYEWHYFVPAVCVTYLLTPLVVQLVRVGSFRRAVRVILIVAILVVGCVGYFRLYDRLSGYALWRFRYRDHVAMLAAKRAEMGDCKAIGIYRSSLPTFGLSFGNDFSRRYYAPVLERIFPNDIRYTRHGVSFLSWSHERKWSEVERQVSEGDCVLVQGGAKWSNHFPGWQLRPLAGTDERFHGAEGLYQLSLDASNPALISTAQPIPGSTVIEAEDFVAGNVVLSSSASTKVVTSGDVPAFAEYVVEQGRKQRRSIRIRYASGEARPLTVRLNGERIMDSACPIPTGGIEPQHQKWHDLGMFQFQKGDNTIRLESDGPFPHVDKIAVRDVRG